LRKQLGGRSFCRVWGGKDKSGGIPPKTRRKKTAESTNRVANRKASHSPWGSRAKKKAVRGNGGETFKKKKRKKGGE